MFAGFERLTVDVFLAEGCRRSGLIGLHDRCSQTPVTFRSRQDLEPDRLLLLAKAKRTEPGGSVGNALVAAARTMAALGEAHTNIVTWAGVADFDHTSLHCLRQFTEAGISNRVRFSNGATTYAVVSSSSKQIAGEPEHCIDVFEGTIPDDYFFQNELLNSRTLLLGLDSLTRSAPLLERELSGRSGAINVLVNSGGSSLDKFDLLRCLLNSKKVDNVFGTLDEIIALGKQLQCPYEDWPTLFGVRLWITNGKNPVALYEPGQRQSALFSVIGTAGEVIESTLGAGDAFAGAVLAALEAGLASTVACGIGLRSAAECITFATARPERYLLNREWLASTPLEKMVREVADLRQHLEITSGPMVISGGQTGVDTIALETAAFMGVPTVGIFPKSFRTEYHDTGKYNNRRRPDLPASVNLHSLSTPGYKERTWATVYCSDATVIFGKADTPGSRETLAACTRLGRPVHLIEPNLAALSGLRPFLELETVRILNVVGNRASLLSEEFAEATKGIIKEAILYFAMICVQRQRRRPTAPPDALTVASNSGTGIKTRCFSEGDRSKRQLRVGVIKSTAIIALAERTSPGIFDSLQNRLPQL